jgi:hypothetical protein
MIFANVHDKPTPCGLAAPSAYRFVKLGFIRMPEPMVAPHAGAGYWACFEQSADEPVFRPAI